MKLKKTLLSTIATLACLHGATFAMAEPTTDDKLSELTARLADLEKQKDLIIQNRDRKILEVVTNYNKSTLDLTRKREATEHYLQGIRSVKPVVSCGPQVNSALETRISKQLASGGLKVSSKSLSTLFLTVSTDTTIKIEAKWIEPATLDRTPHKSCMATTWELEQQACVAENERDPASPKYRQAQQDLVDKVVAEFIQQYKKSNRKR
jgi:hypothetical protein